MILLLLLNVVFRSGTVNLELIQDLMTYDTDKNGADPSQVEALALYIRDKCPQLRLAGLMTIGAVESSTSDGENPDFEVKDQTVTGMLQCDFSVHAIQNI